jgi:EAL domain-containing protein (putative c-di-GMP-specific phosphodiesterase class I)
LHRLPTHAIKIDRSFINQVTRNPEIVRAILALAGSLDMRVEAEGIETSLQLACLRELGCQFGQGLFFSRPVPSGAAARLVDTHLAH